jgi:hypothetical protein
MIDPRTQYIVYKERENALMTQIERKRAARERGALIETGPDWILAIEQWLKTRALSASKAAQKPVHTHAAS